MVIELPNDFLVASHLEELRLFADVAVAEVIAKHGVAVRQSLAAGHQSQRVARQIVLVEFSHDLFAGIEFNDLVPVAAGDEQVTVW